MTKRLLVVQARKTTRPKDFVNALAEAYPEVKVRPHARCLAIKEAPMPCCVLPSALS